MAACNLAVEFGFRGPNVANAKPCASGAVAIGTAFRASAHGEVRVALAFKARVTGRNQLTLPAALATFLEAQPRDDVEFLIDDDGSVRVAGPSFAKRVGPWVGRFAKEGGQSRDQIDTWVRELRGARD